MQGVPNSLDIQKAASILQDRPYFEGRTRELLVPFTKDPGEWVLVTLRSTQYFNVMPARMDD